MQNLNKVQQRKDDITDMCIIYTLIPIIAMEFIFIINYI